MRKALLVGINRYPGQPLRGCVNDVDDMATLLTNKCGFDRRSITRIVDQRATKRAILDALRELVSGAANRDTLLFHFSGHGTQMANREVEDGLEEVLCPADFDWTEETDLEDDELVSVLESLPHEASMSFPHQNGSTIPAAHGFESPDRETSRRILDAGHGAARSGPIARAFWWDFHIEIPHDDLVAFVRSVSSVNDVVSAIGGSVPRTAAPWIALVAGFIAGGLQILQAVDTGRGVHVSMSWFAPGIFVPTAV